MICAEGDESDSGDEMTIPDSTSGHDEDTDPDATTTLTKSTGDLSSVAADDEARMSPLSTSQRGAAKAATTAANRGLQVKIDKRRSGALGMFLFPFV